jgi:hypothetical protein
MRTALDMDRIHDFPIFQNCDGPGINVADVNRIVLCDDNVAATGRRPRLDKLSISVENGDSLVVAVGNQQAAFRIDGDSVRQLKLAWSVTLDTADDFDELSILRKLHHA